jgi:hypothetical protein
MAGAFDILAGMDYVSQRGEQGRKRGEQTFANRLLGEAYNATGPERENKLGALAKTQPGMAMDAGQQFGQMDDQRQARRKQLVAERAQTLSAMDAATRMRAWPAMRQAIIAADPELGQALPEMYDDATFAPVLQQLAGQGNSDIPSEIRTLRMIQADPSLLETQRQFRGTYTFKEFTRPDGSIDWEALNNRSGQPGGMSGGGPAPAPAPQPQPTATPKHLVVAGADGQPVDEFANLPDAVRMRAAQLEEAGLPFHIAGGRLIEGESAGLRQPTQQPVNNTRLPSIMDIGGGDPAFERSGGRQTDADRARAKANESAMVERAKIGAQLEYAPRLADAEVDATRRKAEATAGVERGTTARTKAPQLLNVERGLDRIDAAIAALDTGMLTDTGPVDQYINKFTETGQELEAAVGSIKNDMLALTRVPGVGSQSDLEQRIGDLKYPQPGNHPAVNKRNLQQLRDFLKDLQESINGAASQGQQAANTGGTQKYRYNPETGDFD